MAGPFDFYGPAKRQWSCCLFFRPAGAGMMNVLDLAGRHVTLKRAASTKGGEYTGPCPGCGDGGKGAESDRFHVWPADKGGAGSYWCRQCEKAGDGIQFLMDFEGKTFPEACAALGMDLPESQPAPRSAGIRRQAPAAGFTPKPQHFPADIWREKSEKLVVESHARIKDQPKVLKWLADRGIDGETVGRFRLGWIDKHFFRPRESWGLETVLKENGKPKKLFIPRGILIPSADGNTVFRLRVRRPRADITGYQKKYYVVPGSAPMALMIGRESNAFVVVETELDAMMLYRFTGDLVGVTAMGSSSIKPDEYCHKVFSRAACILNALDFDPAGKRAWPFWEKTYPAAERWPVPVGKDPGEAYEQGVDIRTWILAGLPPAWHVARAPKPSRIKMTVPADPNSEAGDDVDLPESLRELRGLLCRYPVRIRATEKSTAMLPDSHFKDEGVVKRISELIFMEATCLEYLQVHPADIVVGKNFDEGKDWWKKLKSKD